MFPGLTHHSSSVNFPQVLRHLCGVTELQVRGSPVLLPVRPCYRFISFISNEAVSAGEKKSCCGLLVLVLAHEFYYCLKDWTEHGR